MSELVLATYTSEEAAEHVFGVLNAHRLDLPGPLDSAATVRVAADGRYTVLMTDRSEWTASFWGVLWEALFGLVFLVPAAGTAYGSALGGLFGAIDRAGLDAGFRAQVRAALDRQSSGLAVIATGWDPAPVLNEFFLRPRAIVRATIVLDEDSELMRELGGVPPGSATS